MSTVYTQNFDSTTPGTLPAGWANIVGTWAVSTVNPVSGARSFGSSSNGDGDVALYTGGTAIADMQVDTRQIAVASGAKFPLIAHVVRSNSAGTQHYVAILFNVSATGANAVFYKKVGGTYTAITSTLTISFLLTAGDTVYVRTKIVGTALQLFVGVGSLPGSPSASVTDSSVTAAGYAGLYNGLDLTSAVINVDDFVLDDTTAASPATAVTLTGPTSGIVGVASTFTAAANGAITGSVVVTPSDSGGGGAFSPTSVTINTASPSASFNYTPASAGAKVVSVTNNGSLTNPSSITLTATVQLYTRVDAVDTIGGQSVMVLAPNGTAAVPYNSAVPTNAIIYAHGAGETQTGLVSDSLKSATRDALLNAGYILAGTNAHGENWGTQAAVDDYVALEKYLRDNYNVNLVAVWSQSMGGMAGLSLVSQGKFPVAGWLGTYPVCSLSNLYGLGTYTSAINSAHAITGSGSGTYANRTRGLDPALLKGFSWKHLPMRMYASAGDTVVPKAANTDALSALVTGCCRESATVVCTGDHGDPSHFQPSDYVAFFARCFATPAALGRPAATRTVTLTLTADGTTPRANLTGLKWSWWDQTTPDLGEYPTDRGSAATTNSSGVLTLSVRSSKSAGGVGWLVVTDSDGTTTQSPSSKAFSGPATLS